MEQGLQRFIDAQHDCYEQVCNELRHGYKSSHWIWYIFPQLKGLGRSPTAWYYGLNDLEEARCYLRHPVLGQRYLECCRLLLPHRELSARAILGSPDDQKLHSSLTLFLSVQSDLEPLSLLLDAFYQGLMDSNTLELLKQ